MGKEQIKVFTGHHEGEGRCFTAENVLEYQWEMESELDWHNEEAGYTKEEIVPFLEKCQSLNIGENATLGIWKIECHMMDKEELENAPEWGGW